MEGPICAQWWQLICKLLICRLLCLPTGKGGFLGGCTGGKPASLARQCVTVAPSLSLRFCACFPCSPLPLSSRHWRAVNHPCRSRCMGGRQALHVCCIRLRGDVVVDGGGWHVRLRRAGAERCTERSQ